MKPIYKYLISFIVALCLGINLFVRSDMPPYGTTSNELSDNYWGIITDIGRRWQEGNFTLFNRGVGGGVSLFSSSHYPVLNPTNIIAKFCNLDQFYLIKLIEPYVLGVFLMMILLWEVVGLGFLVSVFGAFLYMSLLFSKHNAMAQSPFFLYGCALFPGMIFAFLKLYQRHVYLAVAVCGSLVAWQFMTEGVTQIPQLLAWWLLLILVFHIAQKSELSFKSWIISSGIFVFFFVSFWAVQYLPSQHFFMFESSRLPGHYPVNNYSIFKDQGYYSLFQNLMMGFVTYGDIMYKTITIIVIASIALWIRHWGRVSEGILHGRFFKIATFTTVCYFLIPPLAGFLADLHPLFNQAFQPLTYFSFRYGLHILEFFLICWVCITMHQWSLSMRPQLRLGRVRDMLSWCVFLFAVVMVIVPEILYLCRHQAWVINQPWLQYFTPSNSSKGVKLLVEAGIALAIIAYRPSLFPLKWVLGIILVVMSAPLVVWCFMYNDKGVRCNYAEFEWDSPEHIYYRNSKGLYYQQNRDAEPVWMSYEYNLIHGVHGTAGFLPVGPTRFTKFMYYYNNRFNQEVFNESFRDAVARFYILGPIPEALSTYFPIDRIIVSKSDGLLWRGFERVVDGEKYDVYSRQEPTQRVYTARSIEVKSFREIIMNFDKPRTDVVMITEEDAREFNIQAKSFVQDPREVVVTQFIQSDEDRLQFTVATEHDTVLVVPERFQLGWQARVNGKAIPVFPAYYLFVGLVVPAGVHTVELFFIPPLLWVGICVSFLSIFALIWLFRKYYPSKGKS